VSYGWQATRRWTLWRATGQPFRNRNIRTLLPPACVRKIHSKLDRRRVCRDSLGEDRLQYTSFMGFPKT
jgi:hypothetical protein